MKVLKTDCSATYSISTDTLTYTANTTFLKHTHTLQLKQAGLCLIWNVRLNTCMQNSFLKIKREVGNCMESVKRTVRICTVISLVHWDALCSREWCCLESMIIRYIVLLYWLFAPSSASCSGKCWQSYLQVDACNNGSVRNDSPVVPSHRITNCSCWKGPPSQ